jgi:hypothetical protein
MFKSTQPKQNLIVFLAVMVLLFLIYTWVYLVAPFKGSGNDLILNLIYLVFSAYPVLLLWQLLGFYERGEGPRLIWGCFIVGFGLFFIGDGIWAILNMTISEVPSFSIADPFYLIGYVFLFVGLFQQYRLIFSSRFTKKKLAIYTFAAYLLATGFALGLTFWRSGAFDVESFLEYLYPVLDLALALIALYLVRTFGQGWLSRPFWGFIALLVADAIYAASLQTGQYVFTVEQDNFYRLLSDMAYNLSYIVFALGFWWQYTLLKTGSETEEFAQ